MWGSASEWIILLLVLFRHPIHRFTSRLCTPPTYTEPHSFVHSLIHSSTSPPFYVSPPDVRKILTFSLALTEHALADIRSRVIWNRWRRDCQLGMGNDDRDRAAWDTGEMVSSAQCHMERVCSCWPYSRGSLHRYVASLFHSFGPLLLLSCVSFDLELDQKNISPLPPHPSRGLVTICSSTHSPF